MEKEFSGIERRLEKLLECLTKLEPLKTKPFDDFEQSSYLRDIVERNLEVLGSKGEARGRSFCFPAFPKRDGSSVLLHIICVYGNRSARLQVFSSPALRNRCVLLLSQFCCF